MKIGWCVRKIRPTRSSNTIIILEIGACFWTGALKYSHTLSINFHDREFQPAVEELSSGTQPAASRFDSSRKVYPCSTPSRIKSTVASDHERLALA